MMRIDKYLAANGFPSRTKAARAIAEGRVKINGKTARAADEVQDGDLVEIEKKEVLFVSEGGFKLYKALCDFQESVSGCIFADIGASTGGFTDCLLQGGAARVYAIDVGESQMAEELAADPRVVIMDNTNARFLTRESFPEGLDGITADVSFISLKLLFPVIAALLNGRGRVFALIKPQFECGRRALDKHGIVKNPEDRIRAVLSVCSNAAQCGLFVKKITVAPVKAHKNIEFVAMFTEDAEAALSKRDLEEKCLLASADLK